MNSSFSPKTLRRWIPVLGFLCAFALAGCHEAEKKVAEEPQPKIDGDKIIFPTNSPQTSMLAVETAEPRSLAITHLTGRLYWNDEATVRIFTPVAGRVIKVFTDLGDRISVGTPLAEIDSPDYSMALANVRTAIGNLAAADKAYSRSKELLAHGAAAEKDVEAAQAAYVAALAEKNRSITVLANYGGSIGSTNIYYILRSPLAGELVDRNITPGQELRADLMLANAPNLFAPLFIVSDPTRLWLQLDMSEANLPLLRRGQKLNIYSPAFPDKAFEGSIENIGDMLDSNTRTIKVRGVVNNPGKLLKAEMYVSVDVVQDFDKVAQSGVEISSKAIFMKDNDSYLFIQEAPGEYLRKQVKLGIEQDGKVPVMQGVTAGEKVVTEGALLLQSILEPAS
jgi:cobalt-zinc-cadmium efflux system membrane fusion protein